MWKCEGEESEEGRVGIYKDWPALLTWQNHVLHGSPWACGLLQLDASICLWYYIFIGWICGSEFLEKLLLTIMSIKNNFLSPLAVLVSNGIETIGWSTCISFLKKLCCLSFSFFLQWFFNTWSLCVGYLYYIHKLWYLLLQSPY
jgi:hypothetical protein